MRKRNKGRMLSRNKSQREALLNALASSLFLKEKLKTTQARAKELKRVSEHMITKAKNNSLASRRILVKSLPPKTVKKLVDDLAPRYSARQGGYTRLVKAGNRASDGAKMAIIELVR